MRGDAGAVDRRGDGCRAVGDEGRRGGYLVTYYHALLFDRLDLEPATTSRRIRIERERAGV